MSGVEKCMCVCVRMVFGVEKNVYVVCVVCGLVILQSTGSWQTLILLIKYFVKQLWLESKK